MSSNNKKLKAGIYDPYLDTLGGGERYCLTVAEILLTHGYDVDLFWSGDPNLLQKAQERFSLNLAKLNLVPDIFGLSLHNIDLIEDVSQIKTSNITKNTSLFKKFNVTRQYDLIFYLSDGSLPFLFAKHNLLHAQVPFSFTPTRSESLLNQVKIKLFKNVVCNSQFTASIVNNLYQCYSQILYPPVDVEKFFNNSPKENIILSVGRFDNLLNSKKQDFLIEAFGELLHTHPQLDYKLILAGGSHDDPSKNQYLSHLQHLAANLPVEFIINPKFSELTRTYSRSQIYWHAAGFGVDQIKHPENTEHFGMTVVEAMASGLVPLVVAKGGLPEIVSESVNGYLWENKADLIDKTFNLISRPNLWASLSQQAVLDSQNYSKNVFQQKLLKLL